MAETSDAKPSTPSENRRGRGPAKTFPLMSLNDVLPLPRGIAQFGVNDQIRRLTLFDKLGRSPDSGSSRQLITASGKYGLTTGSYHADLLTLTPDGRAISNETSHPRAKAELHFKIGIVQFEPFVKLYERLKGRRMPDD